MNPINTAIHLAQKTARSTSWSSLVIYDYSGQLFCKETIRLKLNNAVCFAKNHAVLMFTEWALTGKWPLFRNQPVYFVREILCWSLDQNYQNQFLDFPNTPPPWNSKQTMMFLDATIYGWLKYGVKDWVNERTEELFDSEEDDLDTYNPMT
jgi:hypothetical protein